MRRWPASAGDALPPIDRGPPIDAPTPIFIHGSGGGPGSWHRQERRFEGAAILTLPGHGELESEPIDSAAGYAEWAAGMIAAIDPPRMLIGHSLGGAIALELAIRQPELVDGLVVIAAGARLPVPDDVLARVRDDFAAERERLVIAAYLAADERTHQRLRDQIEAAGPATLAADYAACAGFDARPRLADVRAPALVIAGADDTLTPTWLSKELAEALPAADMVLIPEAGHMVIDEQGASVNLLIAAYLARLELSHGDDD